MKRILTLLILSVMALGSRAQVLFSQDFQTGSIDPMTAVDVDGRTVASNVSLIAGPTFQTFQQGGNFVAVSTSWFDPPGQADDWLISPPITVTDANTFLYWRAYTPDANYRDGYQVRISTTDNAVASFTNLALNVAQELTSWTQRSVKLNAYVGQTIYFAFRNNSDDKFLLYMDDIKVEVLKNSNAIVKSLTFPERYNAPGTEIPVKISVENHGAVNLTSFLFDYSVNGNTYSDSIIGLNIAPLKSNTLTHSLNFTVNGVGEFPVEVKVSSPNGLADEDSSDNVIIRPVYGLDTYVPKKVLVEEATGTWCQWCPRGAVMMENLFETYGDQVLPVAVHNADPMTISEYDAGMGSLISGYPSGLVDRKANNIDPLQFDSTYNVLINRIVPVVVTTNVNWEPGTRTATITGKAHMSVNSNINVLRFNCIITEDKVHQPEDPNYNQANIYSGGTYGDMGTFDEADNPVLAENMYYDFVARAIIGGFRGEENSVPNEVDANEDFNFSFIYEVPADFDETQMRAIIIVQDEETGEVLNGDIQKLNETTSVPLVPVGHFSAYPNPTSDILNLTVDYKTDAKVTMKVYTTMGQLVRDLGNLDLTNGNQSTQIRVADLASGNYILELRDKNSVTALPFTKM